MKEEFKYWRRILRGKAVSMGNMNVMEQIINIEFQLYSKHFKISLQIPHCWCSTEEIVFLGSVS